MTTKKKSFDPDKKSKEDLKKLGVQLSGQPPQEEEKRKPGRPPKEKPEPSLLPPLIPSIDFEPDFLIAIFVKLPFERIAKERGDHWKLTDDEEIKLKELLNKLVEKYSKYIPQWLVKYNLEFTGIIFVGSMITRRLQVDRNLKAENKEKEPPKPEGS